MRTLLLLQFYNGDLALARKLLRLMLDFQPGVSEESGVMLAARFDTKIPQAMVEETARHFHVYTHVSRRRATGWPFGSNELWFDSMQRIHEMRTNKQLRDYDTVLCLEADDAPLQRDWIARLRQGWREAQKPCVVMGHMHPFGSRPGEVHINGNALFSLDSKFLKQIVRAGGCAPNMGWDCAMAPLFFREGGRNTPLIRNWYGRKSVSKGEIESLRGQGCVLLHGVKDGSALKWSRELNPPS